MTEQNDILCTLEPADYWEWRTTIEELEIAKLNHQLAVMKVNLMEKDKKILTLETGLFRNHLNQVSEKREDLLKEYRVFKHKLEEKYKVDLADCVIGEYNYEVRKAPKAGE